MAEKFHRIAQIELPDVKAHAVFHAIIENQIAMQHPPAAVQARYDAAVERLTANGWRAQVEG